MAVAQLDAQSLQHQTALLLIAYGNSAIETDILQARNSSMLWSIACMHCAVL